MEPFPGTPSEALPGVLAHGTTDVRLAVLSMSRRSADGEDARYLEWHCLDHLPEQYRIAGIRLGMRLVSTPACRAVRAASEPRFDPVDHIVHYLFADPALLPSFFELGVELGRAGRMGIRLPRHEVGAYTMVATAAAPRVVVGADVIPWRPARGVYVLIEEGTVPTEAPTAMLTDVPGVAGVWSYAGAASTYRNLNDTTGLHLSLCYLDDDPVTTGQRLAPVLAERRSSGLLRPLLAAPFHTVVTWEWDAHLP